MRVPPVLFIAVLFLLIAAAIPTVVSAKNYDVVYRDVFVHDDGLGQNPPAPGVDVEIQCDWYNTLDGETDVDGYATIYFEDPYPFPSANPPLQWVSTVENVPGWEPVGPTTISTDKTVMLHEHIWNGDFDE